jgi:hypothetical protein
MRRYSVILYFHSQKMNSMKKISTFRLAVSMSITFALILGACQQEVDPLEVPTYGEEGQLQVITKKNLTDDMPGEAVVAVIGGTCEYKTPEGACKGALCLVFGKELPLTGVFHVKTIGTLIIEKDEKTKTLVIGIPFDKEKRTVNPRFFIEFLVDHEPMKKAAEDWFIEYHGPDAQLLGWDNEEYAREHIDRQLHVKK